MRPVEWAHGKSLRLLEWFNQERWTLVLTLLALTLANLVILYFFLQGQDNRAIAFVVLLFAALVVFLYVEVGIVIFLGAGAGLFVHTMYYAIGQGTATGGRLITLALFLALSTRAIYEYVRTPASERIPLSRPIIISIMLFWIYYMMHIAYIYIFRFEQEPINTAEQVLGYEKSKIFRYHDFQAFWISVPVLMILLRDYLRFKRVLIGLGVVMLLGVLTLVWEYFAPLPQFWKVVFQLQAAGETLEGYRVRNPASLYLFLVGYFTAIFLIGHARGKINAFLILYIFLATFGILITKNRILWAGVLLILPLAVFLKPPTALWRQLVIGCIAALIFSAVLLHPSASQSFRQIYEETVERWERNFRFGGDPRNDGSYQFRVREREAWEVAYSKLTPTQKLFGAGLEAQYGFYVSLSDAGYTGKRFSQLYYEKTHIHFAWLGRLLQIGVIGTLLLALCFVIFFIRSVQAFLATSDPLLRGIILGIVGATVGVLSFDMLHTLLPRDPALPVIALWCVIELVIHWSRHKENAAQYA